MARRSHGGDYPENWEEIAKQVKDEANWRCIRCNHPHDIESGHVLTVHHLDMNPGNCAWWNVVALCQRCHLHIQHKVIMHRTWAFEHAVWFKPYVAGFYAHYNRLPEDREYVEAHKDLLIMLGQGKITKVDYITLEL